LHGSRQNPSPHCSVLLWKTSSQHAFVTAITPIKICSSYRCAVTQLKCTAALVPLFSAALENKLTAGLCHYKYTYGDLLSIQVCSDPAQMHCSNGLDKMHSPLFSAALENRLTAGFCHCNYTYGGLLFKQVCSHPAEMHCSTGPTVQCCSGKQAHSRLMPLQLHLERSALYTGVQ